MRIKFERSGGLAGITLSNEIDAKKLPTALTNKIKKIMESPKLGSLPLKTVPKGATDHYTYKISILDGATKRTIECTQYGIQDDLKSLIGFLEKYSNKGK